MAFFGPKCRDVAKSHLHIRAPSAVRATVTTFVAYVSARCGRERWTAATSSATAIGSAKTRQAWNRMTWNPRTSSFDDDRRDQRCDRLRVPPVHRPRRADHSGDQRNQGSSTERGDPRESVFRSSAGESDQSQLDVAPDPRVVSAKLPIGRRFPRRLVTARSAAVPGRFVAPSSVTSCSSRSSRHRSGRRRSGPRRACSNANSSVSSSTKRPTSRRVRTMLVTRSPSMDTTSSGCNRPDRMAGADFQPLVLSTVTSSKNPEKPSNP